MNLSPEWVATLAAAGFPATHWSEVGPPNATDTQIMEYARINGFVVFTHDLDYGALLHSTQASAPSVFQLRAADTRPSTAGSLVIAALARAKGEIQNGALVTIHPAKTRISFLPLPRRSDPNDPPAIPFQE